LIDRSLQAPLLRRELRSAERFSELAIFFALDCLNTPPLRSSASLSRVTCADHRFVVFLRADVFAVLLRVVVRRDAVLLRGAMVNSLSCQGKTAPRERRS
jgi:hypothetical protein